MTERKPYTRIPNPTTGHPSVIFLFAELDRQERHIKQVSKRSGVDESTISNWKSRYQPNIASIEAVLNVLGFTLTAVPLEKKK